MDGLKIYYKFRNGDYLVVPADGFLVNGKCVDICREDEMKIDFNPYHDKRGRFTTKAGSSGGASGGAFVRPKEMYLWDFPKKDGETSKEWLARFEAAKQEQDDYMDSFYKESEDRLKQYIGKHSMPMNLRDELEPEVVKDLADNLDAFAKLHPEIKGAIDFIRTDELPTRTVAQFTLTMNHGNGIELNKKYYKDRKTLKEIHKMDLETNYHTQGTDEGQYFQHELAHALNEKMDSVLFKKGLDAAFKPNGNGVNKLRDVNLAKELYDKVYAEQGVDGIAVNVSRYATTNAKEFFAECMAESVNSPNPRPMATQVAKEFRELIKAKEALLEG